MNDPIRKKSPRAPTIALDDALDRALKAYDKDRLHPASADVIAQHIGYKGANGGAALSALASLRYYGLLERPREGMLAVSKDVEAYKYAPSEDLKQALLISFLRRPELFSELLDEYGDGLPSDANLKYALIQRGFIPLTADTVIGVIRRSVEFAGVYAASKRQDDVLSTSEPAVVSNESVDAVSAMRSNETKVGVSGFTSAAESNSTTPFADLNCDQIPVRLTGGRRAWLTIPTPFFRSDRDRLKAQLDLLLTEDDDAKS